ncbi:MAG: hypothetical protein ABI948_07980 [Thermoleophilia bacterium]
MKTVIALALGALALLPAANAAPSRTARVAITSLAPFTVRGSSFQPAERVALLVSVKSRWERTVVASSTGSFVARFTGPTIGPCSAYFVRARGNRGSLAVIKVMPECPAPPQPVDQ